MEYVVSVEEKVQGEGQNFLKRYHLLYSFLDDRKFADKQSKIFRNVMISDLPKGHNYNYVITKGGDVVYGQVDNSWEFGVKHGCLAGDKDVVLAGELHVSNDNRFAFNLTSGTFMKRILKDIHQARRRSSSEYVYRLGLAAYSFFDKQLLPGQSLQAMEDRKNPRPDFLYAIRICKNGIFKHIDNVTSCAEIQRDYEAWVKLQNRGAAPAHSQQN